MISWLRIIGLTDIISCCKYKKAYGIRSAPWKMDFLINLLNNYQTII